MEEKGKIYADWDILKYAYFIQVRKISMVEFISYFIKN